MCSGWLVASTPLATNQLEHPRGFVPSSLVSRHLLWEALNWGNLVTRMLVPRVAGLSVWFLPMLRRRFTNVTRSFCCIHLVGRSWRTWRPDQITLDQITPTYLYYTSNTGVQSRRELSHIHTHTACLSTVWEPALCNLGQKKSVCTKSLEHVTGGQVFWLTYSFIEFSRESMFSLDHI